MRGKSYQMENMQQFNAVAIPAAIVNFLLARSITAKYKIVADTRMGLKKKRNAMNFIPHNSPAPSDR